MIILPSLLINASRYLNLEARDSAITSFGQLDPAQRFTDFTFIGEDMALANGPTLAGQEPTTTSEVVVGGGGSVVGEGSGAVVEHSGPSDVYAYETVLKAC